MAKLEQVYSEQKLHFELEIDHPFEQTAIVTQCIAEVLKLPKQDVCFDEFRFCDQRYKWLFCGYIPTAKYNTDELVSICYDRLQSQQLQQKIVEYSGDPILGIAELYEINPSQESENDTDIHTNAASAVPTNYLCISCGVYGDHWIMKCPELNLNKHQQQNRDVHIIESQDASYYRSFAITNHDNIKPSNPFSLNPFATTSDTKHVMNDNDTKHTEKDTDKTVKEYDKERLRGAMVLQTDDYSRNGAVYCKWYNSPQGCKYGMECRFTHQYVRVNGTTTRKCTICGRKIPSIYSRCVVCYAPMKILRRKESAVTDGISPASSLSAPNISPEGLQQGFQNEQNSLKGYDVSTMRPIMTRTKMNVNAYQELLNALPERQRITSRSHRPIYPAQRDERDADQMEENKKKPFVMNADAPEFIPSASTQNMKTFHSLPEIKCISYNNHDRKG